MEEIIENNQENKKPNSTNLLGDINLNVKYET